MRAVQRYTQNAMAAFLCLSLIFWSLQPNVGHAPTVIETVQEHLLIIAEHGHTHGFEEDLLWAMHGHSHDGADHDHSQMVIPEPENALSLASLSDDRAFDRVPDGPTKNYGIDRPPRV